MSQLTKVCVFFFTPVRLRVETSFQPSVYKLTVVCEEEAFLGRHRFTDVCVQLRADCYKLFVAVHTHLCHPQSTESLTCHKTILFSVKITDYKISFFSVSVFFFQKRGFSGHRQSTMLSFFCARKGSSRAAILMVSNRASVGLVSYCD